MSSPFTKVVVLGSNSFIASHFIRFISEKDSPEILAISRSEEFSPILCAYRYKTQRERIHFHQLDINQDLDKILSLIDDFQPQLIVNYAAQAEVRNSWKWPEEWYQTNCMSIVKFTSALVDKPYLKKYIAISTPEVYGSTGENIPESHHYYPSTPYAASKLAGDLHLFALNKRYDFPVSFTRAANVYGIHQQLFRIIPRTIIYFKEGKKLTLHNRGKTLRSFIHAGDVAEATYLIARHGKDGEVYHIAPEETPRTIADVAQKICDEMECDFQSSVDLVDENFGQDAQYSLGSEKIRKDLGWEIKIDLDSGVQETIQWIHENWNEIQSLPHDYIHKA